ncbi:TrkH family potassium uptake protein [Candidatus Woesearchaeota archaeon]|nr:TrkH family potassium uptake protein [Candidatus Woesearchaeota archaeon]
MNILIRYLGYILIISALFRVVPIIAGIIYGESIFTFVLTMVISFLLGYMLLWFEKKKNPERSPLSLSQLNLPNALVLVGLSFLILPLISAISFLPSFHYNFLNALFESVSGFTTTGLTLYNSTEGLPQSLLLWRAETQWIGGIGIVMIFLFIISRLRYYGQHEETQIESTSSLYQAQGFQEKMEPNLKKSSKNVLIIYGGYTLLGIILLYITGMNLFEAISLTFTSISTGGFIVTDTLQATNVQLGILSVLMLLGSISFITHNDLLMKRFKSFLKSYEKNLFLVFLLISIGLTLFVFRDVRVVVFELISAFTTTGYSITNISVLPPLFLMLIMLGMVTGGSIASTSGGMKVSRVYSVLKMAPWMIKRLSSPRHAIIPLKIRNQVVEQEDLLVIFSFVALFFMSLFVGILVFLLLGYSLFDSSFQMASALGTVGLQTIDLMAVPVIGKIVLMLAMLLGRLEIFPLFIILRKLYKTVIR